jgi:hypothetical protein
MARTVTEDASVASSSIEEALESGFLPDDPHYRKTGRFADDKEPNNRAGKEEASAASTEETEQDEQHQHEDQQHAGSDDASAASDADAAASRAAQSQEGKDKSQTRSAQKSETRWAKLARENRELKQQLARQQQTSTSSATRSDTSAASQPAAEAKSTAEPRPQINDVDAKTGKPKFATYDDFLLARDEWNQNEAIRKFQETSEKTQRERQFNEAKQTIAKEWIKRVDGARSKYSDFDDVALNVALPLKEGSVADAFILDSAHGTDVLYYLGAHPEELERINGLNPIAQARELTRIELKVSDKSSSSSARPVTQAPRPPQQVSGKGTVAKDAVEAAVAEQDTETYIREQNSRDPRLLALRKRK